MSAPSKRLTAALVGVAVLAFWTRMQFVQMYGGHEVSYLDWALRHYFGALSGFYVTTADAWRRGEVYRDLLYPPGYVAFLAGIGALATPSIATLRAAQAIVDASAVVAVYVIAADVGLPTAWSLVAAAAYAMLPLWAAASTFLLAESLLVPLLLWALVLLVVAARASSWWLPVLCGLWIGICALVRPDAVMFIVPAVVVFIAAGGRPFPAAAALVGAFALVLLAWGAHNRGVHGSWVFTSTSGGAGLWEGLGEIENTYGYTVDDSAANAVVASHGFRWGSIEGDRVLKQEYVRAWREHPAFVARAGVARVSRILFHSDRLQPLFFGRVRELLDGGGFAMLLIALWIVRRTRAAAALLIALPLFAIISVGMVHLEPRYVRYVPVAYVVAFAVVGSAGLSTLRRKTAAAATVLSIVLVMAGAAYTVRELVAIRAAARAGILQP
jgi:hypothetical protein